MSNHLSLKGLIMLVAMFHKDGKTIDFGSMEPSEAVKKIVIGKPVSIWTADIVVSSSNGTIAALEMVPDGPPKVAIKNGVSPDTVNNLLALLIDDEASYDGIEEFFDDFSIRFVP